MTLIRLSQQPLLERCGKAPELIESTEDKIQNYPQSITDEFAYFTGSETGSGEFAYRWPLCDYDHRVDMPTHLRGHWIVLNDELFVANTHDAHKDRSGLEVVSLDGQVELRSELAKDESASTFWAPIRSSERASRIAVDVLTIRGGNRMLDISGHIAARRIAVYDLEAGKEVASVSVNSKCRYRFEFDLSPDGHCLAILEDDTLKVVDLDQAREADKASKHGK